MKKNTKPFHKQKKSLSQIFLIDDTPCHMLVDLLISQGVESVLEIGPGEGVLTFPLAKRGLKVTSVEKDSYYAALLKKKVADDETQELKNLEVIEGDILEFDIDQWIKQESPKKLAVCGNIPYHISTPILFKIMSSLDSLTCSVLLVQLEYAERLVSKPSSKSFGSLSVFVQLRSNAHFEYKVDKKLFRPVPSIDSAVVSFFPLKEEERIDPLLLKKVEKITRHVFTLRRKKLSNSLKPFLKDKDLTQCPISLDRRCDALLPGEFVSLTRFLIAE